MGSLVRVSPKGTHLQGTGFFTELYGLALPAVIITTRSVVGDYQGVVVEDVAGWKNDGVVVGVSEDYDLACIWVQPKLPLDIFERSVLEIGDSDGLRVHDTVFVLGFSDEGLPADTAVDEVGERYMTLRRNTHPPDGSGYAVINEWGEVVGVIRGGASGRIQDQAILINRVREEMPKMCGSAIP